MNSAEFQLTDEQQLVYRAIVERRQSALITGSAGTGKSYLLRAVIDGIKRHRPHESIFVTATTGAAAVHIDGQTIYKFAGVGLMAGKVEALCKLIKHTRWQECSVLIIDEVSMLDAETLDKLHHMACFARRVSAEDAFMGGIQVVMCGDYLQLPPIKGAFNFTSQVFKRFVECHKLVVFVLHDIHRQKGDAAFIEALQKLRVGVCDRKTMETLKPACTPYQSTDAVGVIKPTQLYARRDDVEGENQLELEKLDGPGFRFAAEDKFESVVTDEQKRDIMKPLAVGASLELRVGAQVMIARNIDVEHGLCNGTRGIVVDFRDDGDHDPIVRLVSGEDVLINRHAFEIKQNKRLIASRRQLPLILAWALTIHKSQGCSLDLVSVHLDRAFAHGQVYVALSRARSISGLWVTGFHESLVHADPIAVDFYKSLEPAHKRSRVDALLDDDGDEITPTSGITTTNSVMPNTSAFIASGNHINNSRVTLIAPHANQIIAIRNRVVNNSVLRVVIGDAKSAVALEDNQCDDSSSISIKIRKS